MKGDDKKQEGGQNVLILLSYPHICFHSEHTLHNTGHATSKDYPS